MLRANEYASRRVRHSWSSTSAHDHSVDHQSKLAKTAGTASNMKVVSPRHHAAYSTLLLIRVV